VRPGADLGTGVSPVGDRLRSPPPSRLRLRPGRTRSARPASQVEVRAAWELEGLDADGEKARNELTEAVSALDGEASRFVERRAGAAAKKAARQSS
jgi:hypothetical protein